MKRNPALSGIKSIKQEWFAGMDMIDMGAAAAGLIASTMIPNYFIKTTDTTGKKVGKIIIAFLCAAGSGFICRNINASAGKSAVAGGVAGTVVQAIAAFTTIQIGGNTMRQLPGIRSSTVVSPSMSREQETVQLITP